MSTEAANFSPAGGGNGGGNGGSDAPPPVILSHVSLGTNRFEEAVAFYDRVLATLGVAA